MLDIEYSTRFVRKFKKLDPGLQDEVLEKIKQFRNQKNHRTLGVHKLTGDMKEQWAFSVNYHDRVVFYFGKNKKTAYLLDVGDHTIYES